MTITLPMFLSPAAQATVCASKSTDAPAVDVFASASGLSEAPGYAARLIGKYCSAVKLRFRRGSLIFAEGATAQYLYLLQVGAARCYKQLPDGRREIIGFALPGDLFGTGAVKVYPHSAEAINATTILRYEWSALAPAAASNGRLARCLLADAYRQLSAAQSQLLLLGRKSAAERVASFLLELLERKTGNGAKPTVIDLPMTRNDIADYLGLTTETVSRVLGQLKTEGVIELPNTKMAIVRDVDRVRTLAAGEVTRISRRQNGHALSWQGVTRP